MKKLKKILAVGMALVLMGTMFTACGGGDDSAEGGSAAGGIHVVTREEGSGTRGAFVELFGIEVKDDAGEKVDQTIETAEVTNSTSVMMQTIAGNESAIGYISLGSLDDTVKALKVDGVEATAENVKSGDYKVSRPFNIVTKADVSETAKDFVSYIMSDEGQAIVEEEGYISEGSEGAYEGAGVSGEITISGSSSVTPVMQKLAEEYMALNKDVQINVQQSDSTTGVTDAIEGISDIGMASREVSEEELAQGVEAQAIALDGIAVIVNNNSTLSEIASESVLGIYTGTITDWADVK
ncbi:MAG: substrate-binding domain-containing protein [Emergencia sp.]|nr:substrate-binding domain-containing protein [Emergencia sp.]